MKERARREANDSNFLVSILFLTELIMTRGDILSTQEKPREDIEILKQHLLQIGGKGFQKDWFLNSQFTKEEVRALLSRGEVVNGRIKRVKMEDNHCHKNVLMLVEKNPELQYWTGVALSGDGIWRTHSWAVNGNKEIIETTVQREVYFGYRLTKEEIEQVREDYWLPRMYTRIFGLSQSISS